MPWYITPPTEDQPGTFAGKACLEFEGLVRRQLELLGEDPTREGLQRAPERRQ